MSKLSKIVQTIKNCQNLSKLYKNFQIVKILVRSCSLITLIKCLKGHKCLGCICVFQNQKVGK